MTPLRRILCTPLLFIAFLVLSTPGAFAQAFTPAPVNLQGFASGDVDWGDYDADGDLDLAIIGSINRQGNGARLFVYRNDGGTFTNLQLNVPGYNFGSVAWGDFDGDDDLDLLVTGIRLDNSTGSRGADLYRNDGNDTFTSVSVPFTPVEFSDAQWGDVDGDGDLDIALSGLADNGSGGTEPSVALYRNDATGFVDVTPSAISNNIISGDVTWGDYDSDGDLDLVTIGENPGGGGGTALYVNDNGTLTLAPPTITASGTGFAQLRGGQSAWGDADGDGDFDLFITGAPSGLLQDAQALYYENDGGTFENVVSRSRGYLSGTVAWVDTGLRGVDELFVIGIEDNGTSIGTPIAPIFSYDAEGEFFIDTGSGIQTDAQGGHAAWGDYDADGDLDLVVTTILNQGNPSEPTPTTRIYENSLLSSPDAGAVRSIRGASSPGGTSFGGTGVTIDFAPGTPPANVTVAFYDAPAFNTTSISETSVSEYRFIINSDASFRFGLGSEVRFDVSAFGGIGAPEDVTVYRRTELDGEIFRSLSTRYDAGADQIIAAVDSLGEFVFASSNASNPLPVELASFSSRVNGRDVELQWETLSETNNAGFAVEHRAEDGAWARLGFVDGRGTTTEASRYRFRASALDYGTHRFRLRQIDLDGAATLSGEQVVRVTLPTAFEVAAYPNPVRAGGVATFDVTTRAAQPVRVDLFDLLGRRVTSLYDGTVGAGRTESIRLPTTRLTPGVYFVRVTGTSFTETRKLTVVR